MRAPESVMGIASAADADLVQSVLDVLPVTDFVYHHLAFTRPLVDALVREVARSHPRRVLVVGPNELLAAVLIDIGFEVELWILDGLPLSDELQRRASRRGSLDEVLSSADMGADVVVAPYVVEAAELEPVDSLRILGRSLAPGGSLIVAARNPGEPKRRWRGNRTDAARTDLPPSPAWPRLPARRALAIGELIEAGRAAGLDAVRAVHVTDHHAFLATEPLSVARWAAKRGMYIAKRTVPALRDCSLVTYVSSNRSM